MHPIISLFWDLLERWLGFGHLPGGLGNKAIYAEGNWKQEPMDHTRCLLNSVRKGHIEGHLLLSDLKE